MYIGSVYDRLTLWVIGAGWLAGIVIGYLALTGAL